MILKVVIYTLIIEMLSNTFYPLFTGLWQGVLISLLLFGPAFFKLINVGMKEGFLKGIWLATGVVISDLLVVALLIYGLSDIINHSLFQKIYSMVAALAMIAIGLKSTFHKYKAFLLSYSQSTVKGKNLWSGFLLNLVNPFTFILWFNLLSTVALKYENSINIQKDLSLNILGILISIFLMDVLKVYLSNFIGKKISPRIFYFVNRYFGVIFILIGLFFIFTFIKLLL